MRPKLSIIVPVYNVENYISRCLESILSQSFRDIEVIIIDDGSTDTSWNIINQYIEKDKRVIAIRQSNQGVSAARNAALKIFKGDYLTFVDPDDFIANDTYSSNMSSLLNDESIDILQYPYCEYIDKNSIGTMVSPRSDMFVGCKSIFMNWWSGAPINYVIWNKIYKRVIWQDVHFNVGHTSEDTGLVSIFAKKAKKIVISERGMYYYQRNRAESYTYNYSFQKHMDMFYAHISIYSLFSLYPDLITEKVQAFTRIYRRFIQAVLSDGQRNILEEQMLITKIFPSYKEILKSQSKEKLWLLSAKLLGVHAFIWMFCLYLKQKPCK